jgi:hypothetical protein
MHLLPNGTVFDSSPSATSRRFDPSTQIWSTIGTTNYGGSRLYGSSVLLPLSPDDNYDARVMILGGGNPSTATTEIIDMGSPSRAWTWGPSMSQPRIEMNAVMLPSGEVLALGGSLNDEDTGSASLNADLYEPTTNTFSSAGANAYPRLYHSVALLLPDATVWVAGGNPTRGTFEQHMEIYEPPYLFAKSAISHDVVLAKRPTITDAPVRIAYRSQFTVESPDAASISNVVLVRDGAVTHAFDVDQRLVCLSFTSLGQTLTMTAPPNGNVAPPGYYMLFILKAGGVPSVARFVQLMH